MLTEREAASVGPRDLKRPGTVQWAWQTLNALKRHWELKELSAREFEDILAELALRGQCVSPGTPATPPLPGSYP